MRNAVLSNVILLNVIMHYNTEPNDTQCFVYILFTVSEFIHRCTVCLSAENRCTECWGVLRRILVPKASQIAIIVFNAASLCACVCGCVFVFHTPEMFNKHKLFESGVTQVVKTFTNLQSSLTFARQLEQTCAYVQLNQNNFFRRERKKK
jgi:hypothetical protein